MHPRERKIRGVSSMTVDGVEVPDNDNSLKKTLVDKCNWDDDSCDLLYLINKITSQQRDLLSTYEELLALFRSYFQKHPIRS